MLHIFCSIKRDINYLLLIPRALTSGENQRTCILLQNVPKHERIEVKVRLHNKNDTKNYDTNTTPFEHGSHEHCFKLQVLHVDINICIY